MELPLPRIGIGTEEIGGGFRELQLPRIGLCREEKEEGSLELPLLWIGLGREEIGGGPLGASAAADWPWQRGEGRGYLGPSLMRFGLGRE